MSTTVKPKKKRIFLNNIYSYLQGWYRYRLYYSSGPLRFLMRRHIRRQIDVRIDSMNRECYDSGSCIKCGCATTALQMANKSCEGFCYPPMMNRLQWKYAKEGAKIIRHNKSGTYWHISYFPEFENKEFKRMVFKFLKNVIMAKTRKKQEVAPEVTKEEPVITPEEVQEKAPVEEKPVAKKKDFTMKEFRSLDKKARELALKGDFKAVKKLTDEPGVTFKAFNDASTGVLKLHSKYEKKGEVLVNELSNLHKIPK